MSAIINKLSRVVAATVSSTSAHSDKVKEGAQTTSTGVRTGTVRKGNENEE